MPVWKRMGKNLVIIYPILVLFIMAVVYIKLDIGGVFSTDNHGEYWDPHPLLGFLRIAFPIVVTALVSLNTFLLKWWKFRKTNKIVYAIYFVVIIFLAWGLSFSWSPYYIQPGGFPAY